MKSSGAIVSLLCCTIVLLSLKTFAKVTERYVEESPQRFIRSGVTSNEFHRNQTKSELIQEKSHVKNNATPDPGAGKFTVIIVTFNEVLLEKT